MTQEEKQLLLKDLCARLPYGVMVRVEGEKYFNETKEPYITRLSLNNYILDYNDVTITPYLRPMSSMTEEERKEINKSYNFSDFGNITIRYHMEGWWDNDTECSLKDYLYLIDWLNEHHFDYRGLIEKGLALEALDDMYK